MRRFLTPLENPKNAQAKALVKVIQAYQATEKARGTVKATPKMGTASAKDSVKNASEAFVSARDATKEDEHVQKLIRALTELMLIIEPKSQGTNPLGVESLPTGTYGEKLFDHVTDADGKKFPGRFMVSDGVEYRTHAHHIVMRNGPANSKAAREAVAKSHKIINNKKWKIELDSRENMIWAPNRGHSEEYAINVWNALEAVKDTDKDTVIRTLKEQGQMFWAGSKAAGRK